MKSVDAAVENAIRSAYDVIAVPRLTVEWNLNRYASVVEVDNDPSDDDEGYDVEMFPIESIVQPNRPTAGIIKARVGEARVSDPYNQYDGKTRSARYYLGSVDDTYKYWTSPVVTDASGVFPTNTEGITKVRPFVNYPEGVKTNRIVVGFEDTFAQPLNFTVRVKTAVDGTYNTVSTNPTINAKGQVIINWNGSWSSANTPSDDYSVLPTIYGVQVRVDSMKGVSGGSPDGVGVHLNLIEISARRVHDLTDRLQDVSDNFDMSEKSLVYPIGTTTSNGGTVTLFNGDGELNNENSGKFASLMEPNAKFTLDYIYTINDTEYTVPQFTLYGGAWMGQRAESVNVECTDFSKYFQEIKPRAAMYLDKSVGEIVWQICDSVGFVDYEIQSDDLTDDHKIPVWYTDGEQTVWELFDDLATATQTAIYFDGYGKLQVRTRTNAYNDAAATSWELRGIDVGTELADIISIDQSDELESNSIKVSYSTTDIDPIVNGQPKTQILWEPEGTVALRACALFRDLAKDDVFVFIPPKEAKIWPFEGMMNIQGELIKYKGKRFVYYEAGVRKTVVVDSQEEMQKYNNKTAFAYRYRNHYNGQLKIVERGVWNSENKAHYVEASGYSVRNIVNGNRNTGVNGFRHKKAESRVYLDSNGKRFRDFKDILLATKGQEIDPGFYSYGIKMRFEKGAGKHQRAGLVFHNNGNNEDGYYVELVPSNKLNSGRRRARRHELVFYSRNGGVMKRYGKGVPLAIIENVDYEIDVTYKAVDNDHIVTVWVNGKKCLTHKVEGADKNAWSGKFGMFLRGDTKVSYEYLYAIRREEAEEPSDDFSYLDKIEGGYSGGQLDREGVYRYRTERRRVKKKWKKVQNKYLITFFDEFGPIVHEVREYNVKFDQFPAISSRLYMSNEWSIVVPEYRADSFNARFYLANATRVTAIANGEDTLKYAGSSASVNHIMAVIGRSITVKDTESVEVKNSLQIRQRGEIQTEISSQWIQSKSMAKDIADWIEKHWSKGADEQQVTIFGNPLIEVGDVVTIEYPDADMSASTHRYFVTGVSNSFDFGLETTLTLRRVVV